MAESLQAFDGRYRLSESLDHLGIRPEDSLLERLRAYTGLLLKWNRTYNLTGAKDEASLVREHLIDSLAAVPVVAGRIASIAPDSSLLVDVGSGAGFPGIVIASVHPHWPIALVEPNGKKTAFLRQAVAALGLTQAQPIGARLQDSEHALLELQPISGSVRHFTCRAVASLPDLVAMIQPHAQAESRLFALKSRHLAEELATFPSASVHSLFIPGFDHQRTVVELPLFFADSPDAAGSPPSR